MPPKQKQVAARAKKLIDRVKARPMKKKGTKASTSSNGGAKRSAVQNTSNNRSVFGPVSSISTAPVSIGNSISGADPVVTPVKDGVRIKGRDYFMSVDATAATVTTWTLTAAAPITPACMVSSAVKGFASSYAEYMVHGVAIHFITSEPTSNAGAIAIYIGKDRDGPGVVTSSPNLLPFVMSDHCTVLSPIWKNASTIYIPPPMWRSTELGDAESLNDQAVGEVFVLTKLAAVTQPGHILIDYDITFRNMQANIKGLTYPITRMKYTQVNFFRNVLAVTANTTVATAQAVATGGIGYLLDGPTPSALPSGALLGDIYKCVLNLTNSTIVNAAYNTLFSLTIGPATNMQTVTLTDGFTFYATFYTAASGSFAFYPNYAAAISNTNAFYFGVSATISFQLPCYISHVGAGNNAVSQANY